MPNETGGPWVMGEPTTNRAEHKCVNGATKYFRADKCVACLKERLAAAEALWETAVQFEGPDWADHIAQSLEAAKGVRDE